MTTVRRIGRQEKTSTWRSLQGYFWSRKLNLVAMASQRNLPRPSVFRRLTLHPNRIGSLFCSRNVLAGIWPCWHITFSCWNICCGRELCICVIFVFKLNSVRCSITCLSDRKPFISSRLMARVKLLWRLCLGRQRLPLNIPVSTSVDVNY